MQVIYLFRVFILNLEGRFPLSRVGLVLIVNALNAQNVHEEVSRVVILRTLVGITKGGKIVNRKFRFVEIHNFAFCKEEKSIETFKDVCVRLVNGRYDSPSTHSEVSQGFHY